MNNIPFNKPYLTGKEIEYIKDALESGQLSGNGKYTKKCCDFFQNKYGFKKVLLTTSCTDALEMTAILLDIKPGDEIIAPSYTFVSTVNAFILRGAAIVFADSRKDHPCIDEKSIEALITPKTKAIIVVHYAGVACNMDMIMEIAKRYNLFVVEDAAQAIDSFYTGKDGIQKPLGSIGHLATFSFHETKNIISGEGGMLVINDANFLSRAEIIWEKGTNRAAFQKGEVDKYEWVDTGSSFLPADYIAAFLYAQLEKLEIIQEKRKKIWDTYFLKLSLLAERGVVKLPFLPDYASNNAQLFYIVCKNYMERTELIKHLKNNYIGTAFHYQSLHQSPYYLQANAELSLPNSSTYSDCLVRLPLYFGLSEKDQDNVCNNIISFYSTII